MPCGVRGRSNGSMRRIQVIALTRWTPSVPALKRAGCGTGRLRVARTAAPGAGSSADEGLSFEEIARLTGTPASTWKSRFAAALNRLPLRLRELGLTPEEDSP